ncbi:hypothetical protein PSEUDO9AZ_10436 [Pseudomonas sp. 9AZ]|nr:hypothetical protein PSEUDO9AZ_10436 [Pseudomonas sp. 9AZ]
MVKARGRAVASAKDTNVNENACQNCVWLIANCLTDGASERLPAGEVICFESSRPMWQLAVSDRACGNRPRFVAVCLPIGGKQLPLCHARRPIYQLSS